MGNPIYPFYQDYMHKMEDAPRGQPRLLIDKVTVQASKLHHHSFGELSLFVGGSGFESIDGVRQPVRAGTASLVMPFHMHVIEVEQPLHKYRCCFDLQLLFGMGDDDDLSGLLYGVGTIFPSFVDFSAAPFRQMRHIFDQLLEEFTGPSTLGRRHLLRAKLTEALLLFLRTADAGNRHAELAESGGILWAVLHYIHTNYKRNLTLEELCRCFHLTAPYLSRLFKAHTGKGFAEYLQRLRVENAATLLLHTKLPVTEICYEAGFESLNTFGRVFRKLKGVSPREYRNALEKPL